MKIKINKNVLLLIVIVVLETLIVKYFMYDILPDKFFYDSSGILNSLNTNINTIDISRKFTIIFFSKINILGLSTLKQWGWTLSAIFSFVIIKNILSREKYNFVQMIFIIMSIVLLNIYVFNIGKDIIQFIIFYLVYLVLKSEKNNAFKITMISLILIVEALVFRVYYLIMALLIITIYIIYKMFFEKKKVEKKNVLKIIALGILIFFAQVYVLQKISIENYNSIMYARSSVNIGRLNGIDANTIIIDLFGNNNTYGIFILNYLCSFVRLLFPFELLLKSFKYIPFIIYQLIITISLLEFRKIISQKNITWLIVILSFLMTSAIFEPDFGSFIRHESTLFLIFLHVLRLYNK